MDGHSNTVLPRCRSIFGLILAIACIVVAVLLFLGILPLPGSAHPFPRFQVQQASVYGLNSSSSGHWKISLFIICSRMGTTYISFQKSQQLVYLKGKLLLNATDTESLTFAPRGRNQNMVSVKTKTAETYISNGTMGEIVGEGILNYTVRLSGLIWFPKSRNYMFTLFCGDMIIRIYSSPRSNSAAGSLYNGPTKCTLIVDT